MKRTPRPNGGPTPCTGWAEWSEVGERDQRVGVVHAVANALAIGTYSAYADDVSR